MISCSLSPNTEADDVWLAFRLLCTPWKWKNGGATARVERQLGGVTFNTGRAALWAILKTFHIGRGDEVILQAFTCVAVADAIRWTGAIPVYADIDDSLNMDTKDFEQKITDRTRAVIVQHTFGIAADTEKIMSIAKKHHLFVIEDFAHTMSLRVKGDAAFYSFGRDKVLSSVFGGLAVMKDTRILKTLHKQLEYPSYFWIFRQLLHPVAFSIILPLYTSGIGKVMLVVLQKVHLLSFPQLTDIKKYPDALARLLILQLRKLDRYTKQRKDISAVYGKNFAYLRYPLIVDDPKKVIRNAKKKGILLGNWYHNVVDPVDPGYKRGSCPKAEEVARHIVNLPTRISAGDAKKVLLSI